MRRRRTFDYYPGQILTRLPLLGERDVWFFASKLLMHYGRGMSLAGYVQQLFVLFMVSTAGLAIIGISVKVSVMWGVTTGLLFGFAYIVLGAKGKQLSVVMNHINAGELTPFFTSLEEKINTILMHQHICPECRQPGLMSEVKGENYCTACSEEKKYIAETTETQKIYMPHVPMFPLEV